MKNKSYTMKIDRQKIKIVNYTPELHKDLLVFMSKQYENRSVEYLNWWLTNLNEGGKELWATAFVVFYNEIIVGCYTSNPISIVIKGKDIPMFYGGNAIIESEYRGVGIGKMMYEEVFKHIYRISIGLTAASYAIQTQKFKRCFPLNDIRVYVSANMYCFRSILNRFINETTSVFFPDKIRVADYVFSHVKQFEDVEGFPEDGIWLNDEVEIKRSKEWLFSRFIDIYRKDYFIYVIRQSEQLKGYAVFRKGRIYGVEFISIVDFRCKCVELEKVITKAAHEIAKSNKVGFTFCMSSRYHSFIRFSPLTIRLKKKIKNVTCVESIHDKDILFTSADSNLDFVYYE